MTSAFIGLQNSLVAALVAAPALAGGRIYANRLRPVSAGSTTAVVVRLDKAEGVQMLLGVVDWTSTYIVECYARAPGNGEPAAAIDQLLSDVWARLCALNANALGAIDITIAPRIDWQYDDGDTPLVCAVIQLSVQHRTPSDSLQAWS